MNESKMEKEERDYEEANTDIYKKHFLDIKEYRVNITGIDFVWQNVDEYYKTKKEAEARKFYLKDDKSIDKIAVEKCDENIVQNIFEEKLCFECFADFDREDFSTFEEALEDMCDTHTLIILGQKHLDKVGAYYTELEEFMDDKF